MLLPVYGEAAFDSTMWYYGLEDKPWSTYVVRPILFIMGGLAAYWLGDREWWRVALVMITYFGAFFPLLINWIRGEKIGYLSEGSWYDRLMSKIHDAPRIWGSFWLVMLALCIYYAYELYYNLI